MSSLISSFCSDRMTFKNESTMICRTNSTSGSMTTFPLVIDDVLCFLNERQSLLVSIPLLYILGIHCAFAKSIIFCFIFVSDVSSIFTQNC